MQPITVRLPCDVIEKLEDQAAEESKQRPGRIITISDLVREAILRSLRR